MLGGLRCDVNAVEDICDICCGYPLVTNVWL